VNTLVGFAAAMDLALLGTFFWRLRRSWERGISLRLRIFCALALAMLLGALATGLYATAVDIKTLGFAVRFAHVAPRAFVLASAFVPIAGTAAALVGRLIARPVEALTAAAERIAEGQQGSELLPAGGEEGRKLSRALAAMRREIADKPYASGFLRDAWHDLKTPVAAIVATLEVLEDGAIDDPTAARPFLANLRRSAGQLEKRLADIVTLARYETSAISALRDADVDGLVSRALDSLGPLAQAKRVHLSRLAADGGAEGAHAPCDEAALGRALGNLLENAILASPGGHVGIALDGHAPGVLGIEIVNEPSVVPADVRRHLFQRASSSRGYSGGSGLGLPIARAAIEAHGGRVHFTALGPPRVALRIELPR
jgi:signal transduction histidine kinase